MPHVGVSSALASRSITCNSQPYPAAMNRLASCICARYRIKAHFTLMTVVGENRKRALQIATDKKCYWLRECGFGYGTYYWNGKQRSSLWHAARAQRDCTQWNDGSVHALRLTPSTKSWRWSSKRRARHTKWNI